MSQKLFHVFELTREEVEQGRVDRLLLGIAREGNERGGLSSIQGRITFFVSGYEKDPRELYEIPEVRAYFHQLDTLAPFFLYYIANEVHGGIVRVFLKMFLPPEFFVRKSPSEGIKEKAINFLLSRLNSVTDYCKKLQEAEGATVDPGITAHQTLRCCGMMVDFDEAKKILELR